MAQMVNKVEISQAFKILGTFPVIFNCKPFLYYFSGLDPIEITKPTILHSPEFIVNSEPEIIVYGEGDIILNINDTSIKLLDIHGYITVNSVIQECYKDNENCNCKMCGDFPLLVQENKINWEGNISKIEIVPNWRTL